MPLTISCRHQFRPLSSAAFKKPRVPYFVMTSEKQRRAFDSPEIPTQTLLNDCQFPIGNLQLRGLANLSQFN